MRSRLVAVLAALCLLGTACGSRLTDEERQQILSALTAPRSGTQTTTPSGGGEVSDGTQGGTTAEAAGGSGTNEGTGGGGGAQEGTDNGGTGGGEQAAACAKATKATATGVTPGSITIATLADISGVQPGLFQSSHQAARAAAAYINFSGGICGRKIEPLLLDSKTDSGGNRAAMLDACDKAFAAVGSMSAFDDGSAAPGEDCGIPDMTAITTNAAKYNASNVFPVSPNGSGLIASSAPKYIAKRYPQAVKKAAMLWLNQAVTKNNATQRMNAYKRVGFNFDYTAEVQVLEANYTRFVQQMQDRGIQYVNMVSDFQNLVRLQKSFRQQNYVPQVRDWDSVAYDAEYLSEPEPVEGSFVFINTAMFEESSKVPEMKLYLEWLQRVSPGAVPDYFGIYTWSGYRLFEKLAKQIGPELTRPKMLAALKGTKEWGANGLHGPHKIGAKQLSTCNTYLQVKNGKFTRIHPASGFDCSGTLVSSR